jgi:secreted Zn-dependent insulinase-like peptidase
MGELEVTEDQLNHQQTTSDSGGIVTPLVDKQQYRLISLPSGLQALLVHDADTDKAAAAMDVRPVLFESGNCF